MEGRLANANDRRLRRASRGVKPGVVETGDDEGVGAASLTDLLNEARNRERLVEIAFDAGRARNRD